MSEKDWNEEYMATQPARVQGRTFGMRGRGFRPFEKFTELPVGRNCDVKDKENGSNEYNKRNGKKGFNRSNDGFKSEKDTNEFKSRKASYGNSNSQDNADELKGIFAKNSRTPNSRYIPEEILEDEELFSYGIRMGSNFSKYNDAEVKVFGKNIPEKIEDFESAGLCQLLLANIKRCSYRNPTPIQKHTLPIIMSGRDMLACAQTGSGKTAAFLIPIINSLLEREPGPIGDKNSSPQFIVVTPTRELAIQIYVEARKFAYGSKIKIEIAYGGSSVRYQLDRIKNGCNILIGTPGRLLDFTERSAVVLNEVRHFVIDEADKMLDNLFFEKIEKFFVHPTINKGNVQILMLSATLPEKIQNLASKFLINYVFLAVGIIGGACEDVEQKFYLVSKSDKRQKLIELLKEHGSGKTLMFVNRKRETDIIATFLSEKDFPATSMHGSRDQELREEALNDFKSGKKNLLIATDVAARGLDIINVAHVINFDLPRSIDEYVHRIGRTGRVGNQGLASNFYDPSRDSNLAPHLVRILAQAQQEIPDFLQMDRASKSWTHSSSNFGGKDIRKRRGGGSKARDEESAPLVTAPAYEEEVW